MGLIIEKQEKIEEYFNSSSVNQSTLKSLIHRLDGYKAALAKKAKREEDNAPDPDYFLIGGAVDTILTGEAGQFEKQYYTSKLEKTPTDVEVQIIDIVFAELRDNNIDLDTIRFSDCEDMILIAANEVGWQSRWKDETRIAKLVLAGQDYFEDLKLSVGKKILSTELKNKIDSIVMSLTTNERTKKYFDRESHEKSTNLDFYFQLPIYFSHRGIDCKALLDMLIVQKNDKGEVERLYPIDLKTMSGNTLQFNTKLQQHRYDIQAAWYVLALTKYFNVGEDLIDDFTFVVESTTSVGTPLVYKITPETLIHGRNGAPEGEFESVDADRTLYYSEIPGYEQLLRDYEFYVSNDFTEDKILEGETDFLTLDWKKGIV